jgi:crotonobetainyl-CoA:carnitine CoA-transferase CaiB-like acyl-CoA transferase
MTDEQREQGPLSGVRVVECAHWHLAPIAGQVLGDLGADVIKVEERGRGDPTRRITEVGDVTGEITGRSLYFEYGNRNKRGIALDLRK